MAINSNICVRCGKEFSKLSSHLKKKKECPAIYIDVDREDMLRNYGKLFTQFVIIKNKKDNSKKCDVCGIEILKKNYPRHMKLKHPSTNNGNTVVNNHGTVNNINNVNNITNNITNNINTAIHIGVVNNFCSETNVDIGLMYDLITEIEDNLEENVDNDNVDDDYKIISKGLTKFIELLHYNKAENTNVYLPDDHSKYGHIYMNNKWKRHMRNDIIEKVIKNAVIKLLYNVDKVYDNILLSKEIDNNGYTYGDELRKVNHFKRYTKSEMDRSIKTYEKEKKKDKLYKDAHNNTGAILLDNKNESKEIFEKTN
jgi:DNA-directed RNA polymerase subunit RPC12/RpoP